jgi:NAD(P)H-binding
VFQGDVSNPSTLFDAVDGSVGLVIAAAPEWWRPGGSESVERRGTVSLIQAAIAAGSVNRIALLSSRPNGSQRAANHAAAEEALRSSGIPYFIIRVPALVDEQGGLKRVVLDQSIGESRDQGNTLARVDAAQIVCQAFVHDRDVLNRVAHDATTGSSFEGYVMDASNSHQSAVLDTTKWHEKFSSLQPHEMHGAPK